MRKTYFSLEDIPTRSNCEKILEKYKDEDISFADDRWSDKQIDSNKYEKKEQLGKGAYGKVYELCKNSNCNYILKTMEFCKSMYEMIGSPKLSYENKFNGWLKEIDNQLKVIECQQTFRFQFVPYVYDAWFCNEKNGDTTFYIVMERFDGNLKDFIKKFYKATGDYKKLLKSFILQKLQILEQALNHINNSCKICLDDIKLENILYKENNNNTYDLVFSDFGTSSYGKDLTENCIKNDIRRFEEAIKEFDNNFN